MTGNNGNMFFKATLDDNDFNRKLDGMQKGVAGLEKEMQRNSEKTVQLTKEQQRSFEAFANVVKSNREALKNATDPTQIALYKKRIDEATASISKLYLTASKPVYIPKTDFSFFDTRKYTQGQLMDSIKDLRLRVVDEKELGKVVQMNQQIQTMENQLRRLQNAGREGFDILGNKIPKVKEEVVKLDKAIDDTTKTSGRFSGGLKNIFSTVASYFGVFEAIRMVIGLIKGAFNTIVEFDSKLLNVSKTTGLTGQELKDLGVSLRGLSEELKVVSVSKLTELAGVAGQLGIKGTQEILAFTEALAQLSITSNIQGEEGAIQIARFLGLVEGDVKNVKALGDELTNLGNNFKVFENEIIKNALAIAQNTGAFELGRQEILAYATSLKETGVEAELTGSALGRTYQQIEKVLRTGKNIENLSKITGKSVEELKESFKTDPQGVVYSFIKGLNEIQKSGGNVNNAITSIGISATRDLRVIGTLATGGFDVLNRAMIDVKDSAGAMQQEFDTASGKISNSIESVKVSWENLILAINGSENVIGTVANAWLGGLAIIINGIKDATTSWRELNRIAKGQAFNEAYEYEKAYYEGDYKTNEKRREQAIEDEQRYIKKLKDLNKDLVNEENKLKKASLGGEDYWSFRFGEDTKETIISNIKSTNEEISKTEARIQALQDLYKDWRGKEKTTTTKTPEDLESEADRKKREAEEKKLKAKHKKQLDFIDELNKAERTLSQTTLSGLDLELAKVNEVYNERIKKAKDLKASQEAINKIEALRDKETEIVTFKRDTDNIKQGLEAQKKDYEDFENYKKQVGIQKAKEMYSTVIDTSKTYMQVLEEEMSKIDLSKATDLEKDRFNQLFKIYQDYSIQKQENDRKNLEELYSMTQSYEQKILVLREEYEKKKADLSKDFTGDDLNARLDILEKEFRKRLSEIIEGFNKENNLDDISETLIGATKAQIMAQIKSLEGYLNTATDLTEVQIKKIKDMINDLNKNLFQASDSQSLSDLTTYYNEVQKVERALVTLEARKKNALDLGGKDSADDVAILNAEIEALNKRLNDLKIGRISAISNEFSKISSFLSESSNKFSGINSRVEKLLQSMAKATNLASQINSSFASMAEHSKATKEGTANLSTAMSAGMGYIGMFMSIVSILDNFSKASERQAKRDADRNRIEAERYLNQLEYERLLSQIEIDRARREQLGLSSRRAELSLLKERYELEISQIERLSKIIFNENAVIFEQWQGGFQNSKLIKLNTQQLQDEISKVKRQLEELYKMDSEAYDPETGLRVRIRVNVLEDYLKQLQGAMLVGKTWQELERDLKSGLIHESMREYVQGYIDLAKSAEEAGYSIEDLYNAMLEMASGTSVDELSNKLADAFRNGEDAVISFGATMEEVLKNAVVTAFKNEFIVKEMNELMKLFDKGFDGKYTPEELDEIRKKAEESARRLQEQWNNVTEGLGFDFGSEQLGGSIKDGIKRITESQADRLTGILTGMQVDVIASRQILFDSKNLLSSSLDNLIAIEVNTRQTADNTYQIVQLMQNNQLKALGM